MKETLNHYVWCWHCNNLIPQGTRLTVYKRRTGKIAYFHEDCLRPHRINALLAMIGIKK